MAYKSTYTGRYNGIGAMLGRQWLHPPCIRAARDIQAAAEARAPVGDPNEDDHPGLYKASFLIVKTKKDVPFRGKPRLRAGAQLVNVAPHARIVEYGNSKTPRYAVLRLAIDAVKAAHRA